MTKFDVIRLSQTKCYLLKARDGYLLIDCGNAGDKGSLLKGIGKRRIALTDIHYLFLTHHHADHCGLLAFLLAGNPRLQVIMSRTCAGYLETGRHVQHPNEHYANPALRGVLQAFFKLNGSVADSFTPYACGPHDMLIDSDNSTLLPALGINGQILLTPGHTQDSISIVSDTLAFVGDAARNTLNFTGTPYEPMLLYDFKICHDSWHKLLAAGAGTILPAHGKPFPAEILTTINQE